MSDDFVDGLAESLGLDPEVVDVGRNIAQMNTDSAGLLLGLMRKNADELEWLEEQSLKIVEQDRDKWKKRAIKAESELDLIRHRFMSLMYPSSHELKVWEEGES
jgi:hypothetical protein